LADPLLDLLVPLVSEAGAEAAALMDEATLNQAYRAMTPMLILYGVVFIVLERRNREKLANYEALVEQGGAIGAQAPRLEDGSVDPDGMFAIQTVDDIDWKAALKIGLFQCLAIIPGTSRSGATIIGGMLTGCSRTAAAEFTFFLAIPIMFGWGLVKIVKYMAAMASATGPIMTSVEAVVLLVGIVTAFVVSVISIKFLMGYIKKNDFAPFGVYRIVVGILVLAYFGVKALLF
jgi:undecaprenyl-diphosphatase